MSKTSSKKRYTQLMSWLDTFKKKSTSQKPKRESRMKYYAKKGVR